jgi:hypothetical protein
VLHKAKQTTGNRRSEARVWDQLTAPGGWLHWPLVPQVLVEKLLQPREGRIPAQLDGEPTQQQVGQLIGALAPFGEIGLQIVVAAEPLDVGRRAPHRRSELRVAAGPADVRRSGLGEPATEDLLHRVFRRLPIRIKFCQP